MSGTKRMKDAINGVVEVKKVVPTTVEGFLNTYKDQIAMALPKHMTPERMCRVALTVLRKNEDLKMCTPVSFFGAIIQCSQLGLEPGESLGHAYLIPFNNKKKINGEDVWEKEVQLMIGYRGMIDLARRSGQIISIESRAVYVGDKFQISFGLNSNIVHEPEWDSERNVKDLTHVYAVAHLKGGGVQFDVMSKNDVERSRNNSKMKDGPVWRNHYEEMAKKTVVRRLFKMLPISIEMQTAVGLDEQHESGTSQGNHYIFEKMDDASFIEVNQDDEPDITDDTTYMDSYKSEEKEIFEQFANENGYEK